MTDFERFKKFMQEVKECGYCPLEECPLNYGGTCPFEICKINENNS